MEEVSGCLPTGCDIEAVLFEHRDSFNGSYNGTLNSSLPGNYNIVYDMELFSPSQQTLQAIMNGIDKYVMPIVILIGILGNTVSFLVYLCTPYLFRQSISVYLSFLAVVDNGFLVSLFCVWFSYVGIQLFHKNGWCQTVTYCTYVCSFLSAWTVVSFTIERWIVVFYPLRRHKLCTRRRAIIGMVFLTVFAVIFYSFSIFTTGAQRYPDGREVCMSTKHHYFLMVMHGIDTVIVIIIPISSIVVLNAMIAIKIVRYSNSKKGYPFETGSVEVASNVTVFRTNMAEESLELSVRVGTRTKSRSLASGHKPCRVLTKRHNTQLHITRALLIVSTVFVVLNLPSSAFRIQALILSLRKEKLRFDVDTIIWQGFLQFLYLVNFASNFFLYYAGSKSFRFAVKRLMGRAKRRANAKLTCRHGTIAHDDT